jgi:hypothetical protein
MELKEFTEGKLMRVANVLVIKPKDASKMLC